MPVVFKGGTSGDQYDYTSGTPSSGEAQPMLDTSRPRNGSSDPRYSQTTGNRDSDESPDVPQGVASDPALSTSGSEDVRQQDIDNIAYGPTPTLKQVTSEIPGITRGAPNQGVALSKTDTTR